MSKKKTSSTGKRGTKDFTRKELQKIRAKAMRQAGTGEIGTDFDHLIRLAKIANELDRNIASSEYWKREHAKRERMKKKNKTA